MPVLNIIRRVGDAFVTRYDRIRYLARYRRNPALYVALGLVAVLSGWRIANGMDPMDLLTEHYIETMLIFAAGVVTRLQVWSPQSVEDVFAAQESYPVPEDTVEFDPRLAGPPQDEDTEG